MPEALELRVPFLDVGAAYHELKSELDEAYRRVAQSGWYVLGEELERFEEAFASHCGVANCLGVGNGLDALYLLLEAAGVGAGDEVIVPANTYIATWLAVTQAGAVPVPVEPDAVTFNLDPVRVERAIGPRTRAMMPVHLYGQIADMDPLLETAREHGLLVIEDAAQAHGALYRGRPAGSLGDAAGFSFYPGKNLGALGDGGAVVSNDSAIMDRVRLLRSYGARTKYVHEIRGVNSRLDPLQAALLYVKLKHLAEWNGRRRRVADFYSGHLANVPDLTLPVVPGWTEPVWHQFVIRHPERDALQAHLASDGIGTLIHYPVPPHLSPAYADLGFAEGAFPITESMATTCLSLPIGPHLTADQMEHVVHSIRTF